LPCKISGVAIARKHQRDHAVIGDFPLFDHDVIVLCNIARIEGFVRALIGNLLSPSPPGPAIRSLVLAPTRVTKKQVAKTPSILNLINNYFLDAIQMCG
jgi:hypothetical protein